MDHPFCGSMFCAAHRREYAYTEFLFDVCQQFGLRYYFAKKERHFVEEVTRVTWANRQEEKTGIRQDIRPVFSA